MADDLDFGGLAMMTTVGFAGPEVRSDVQVSVTDASALQIIVNSSVAHMYRTSLEQQVKDILKEFGNPPLEVTLEDSGALPFVIEARVEAAVCRHLAIPLPTVVKNGAPPKRDRARRTRLYVPGNGPKLMPNAGLYGSDGVILDLEDSVPPGEKHAALALVRRALLTLDFGGAETIVRINGIEDLKCLVPVSPDIFLVPKVESSDQLKEISGILESLESHSLIIAIIESALGVERAFDIASSSPRLVAMTLGVEDYLADTKSSVRFASDWANSRIMNACRAAGITPLASVTSVIDNEEEITEYAQRMKAIGFEGVGCIHPRQIGPVHRAYAPTIKELEWARNVVSQFEAALVSGRGAIAVDGRMVDAPVYQQALRTLDWGSPQ